MRSPYRAMLASVGPLGRKLGRRKIAATIEVMT